LCEVARNKLTDMPAQPPAQLPALSLRPDRLGFEIVGEDQIQFHMRVAPHTPAQREAERMSDKG
jgi:hypothetical protein